VILKLSRKAAFLRSLKPATHRPLADVIGCGNGAEGKIMKEKVRDHFGSHFWSKSGISVHVVRAGFLEVECSSTTSLPNLSRADNLLKHDT